MATEATATPPITDRPKKRGKAAKPPRDHNREPVRRERSARMLAMAALERAEKKRPPLAAKLAGLEAAKANLTKLDEEITGLRADVVRITTGGASVASAPANE